MKLFSKSSQDLIPILANGEHLLLMYDIRNSKTWNNLTNSENLPFGYKEIKDIQWVSNLNGKISPIKSDEKIYFYSFTNSEKIPLLFQPNFYWSKDSSQVILTSKCPSSRCIKTKDLKPVLVLDDREVLSLMYDINTQFTWDLLELSQNKSFKHENIKNIQWFSTIDGRVVPVKLIK